MKNHASNRAGKGKTAYRTPHSFIADRPESLKKNNSHITTRMKANNKKFRAHPGPFTH